MVVEDDHDIRETLREIIEGQGCRVRCAANGREALDLLTSETTLPSLLLVDLMMPVMDGRSFRRAQLEDPRLATIPVVIVTAFRDSLGDVDDLEPLTMLRKPIQLKELVRVIRAHCTDAPDAS
ncbi:MAG: response regulator [Polyangiales bacterium]|nr:response regulator [Myxococcales bacterium]